MQTRFNAPWGLSLKIMTLFSVLILGGLPAASFFKNTCSVCPISYMFMMLPLAVLVCGMFFIIRGYSVTTNELKVQRLGWNSKLSLAGIESIEVNPEAMAKSIRTCGNGGLFCFAGTFRNKELGSFRAFATDPKNAVVLTFADHKLVVTPGEPEAFVAAIKEATKLQ